MAQRYVRVKTTQGHIHYGLLQLSHSVQVFDAPPWLQGQPTDLELSPDTYQILARLSLKNCSRRQKLCRSRRGDGNPST